MSFSVLKISACAVENLFRMHRRKVTIYNIIKSAQIQVIVFFCFCADLLIESGAVLLSVL